MDIVQNISIQQNLCQNMRISRGFCAICVFTYEFISTSLQKQRLPYGNTHSLWLSRPFLDFSL